MVEDARVIAFAFTGFHSAFFRWPPGQVSGTLVVRLGAPEWELHPVGPDQLSRSQGAVHCPMSQYSIEASQGAPGTCRVVIRTRAELSVVGQLELFAPKDELDRVIEEAALYDVAINTPSHRLASYEGQAPLPAHAGLGGIFTWNNLTWELQLVGGIPPFGADLEHFELSASPDGPSSCRVRIFNPESGHLLAAFELPGTTASCFNYELSTRLRMLRAMKAKGPSMPIGETVQDREPLPAQTAQDVAPGDATPPVGGEPPVVDVPVSSVAVPPGSPAGAGTAAGAGPAAAPIAPPVATFSRPVAAVSGTGFDPRRWGSLVPGALWSAGLGVLFAIDFFAGHVATARDVATVGDVAAFAICEVAWIVVLFGFGKIPAQRWVYQALASAALCGGLFFMGPMVIFGAAVFGTLAVAGAAWTIVASACKTLLGRTTPAEAVAAALFACAIVAAAFFAVPDEAARSWLVIVSAVIACGALIALGAWLVWQLARKRAGRLVVGGFLAVLALEAGTAVSLNAYADHRIGVGQGVVADLYSDLSAAVFEGNAIAAGNPPSGASFSSIRGAASWVKSQLASLSIPGQLADYADQVKTWASQVVAAAQVAARGGPWAAADTPAPFFVTMTDDQVQQAFNSSLPQVLTALQMGNQAQASSNWREMEAVGSRLDAISYWLEGVDDSVAPGLVQSQLHFLEPLGGSAASSSGIGQVQRSWRAPRANAARICDDGVCLPQLQSGSAQMAVAALDQVVSCPGSATCSQQAARWSAAQQFLAPLLAATSARSEAALGSLVPPGARGMPVAFQAFAKQCFSQGGVPGIDPVGMQRLPVGGGGWRCDTTGGRCWSFLSYSGAEYRGGDRGCSERNLLPEPYGPIGSALKQATTRPASQTDTGQGAGLAPTSWDGTYDCDSSESTNVPIPAEAIPFLPGGGHLGANGPFQMVVSGNQVLGMLPDGPLTIDHTGRAEASDTKDIGQGVTVTLYLDLQFIAATAGSETVDGTADVAITGDPNGVRAIDVAISGTNITLSASPPTGSASGLEVTLAPWPGYVPGR